MLFTPDEPTTIEELLKITGSANRINVRRRPRMKPGDEWKDPLGCCGRMGTTWEEAIEEIIMPLRKEDLYRGPEESRTESIPQKKWVFKVYSPPRIAPRRRLYIKLSSRQPKELLVESFHETEKPRDYIDINGEID